MHCKLYIVFAHGYDMKNNKCIVNSCGFIHEVIWDQYFTPVTGREQKKKNQNPQPYSDSHVWQSAFI